MLKDFVDGKDLSVEIMNGTKEVASQQSKIITASNKTLTWSLMRENLPMGVVRRIRVQKYESRFLEGVCDNYEAAEFKREDNYEDRYKSEVYKNAYFHLLLEHIDSLNVPPSAKLAFQEIADDYDEFTNLLEERYLVTKKEEDKVAKAEIEGHFADKRFKWSRVLAELKRLGLSYKRDGALDGKRGVVSGLKQREDYYDSD